MSSSYKYADQDSGGAQRTSRPLIWGWQKSVNHPAPVSSPVSAPVSSLARVTRTTSQACPSQVTFQIPRTHPSICTGDTKSGLKRCVPSVSKARHAPDTHNSTPRAEHHAPKKTLFTQISIQVRPPHSARNLFEPNAVRALLYNGRINALDCPPPKLRLRELTCLLYTSPSPRDS